MDNNKKKCNFKDHKEIDAIIYCQECKIYMCNKCSIYHKGLIETHHLINIDENISNIFTGYCNEKNHPNKLNYFCKSHNKLCCAACIAKINDNGDGQHKDCQVCTIKFIEEEKRNKLKENINSLEELANGFEKSIGEVKKLFQKINDNKEELKLKVQKIFTKIRTKLNEREDELLKDIDEQFNKIYCDEKIIKESEKLPGKIKTSLEKGKLIDKEWKFIPKENGINEFLDSINLFGKIETKEDKYFIFRESPIDKFNKKRYSITGNNKNILTKIENNEWIGILCENELSKSKEEHKWKIKIIKNKDNHIRVGIVPKDYNINSSNNYSCGWCFYNYYAALYSGPPQNFNHKNTNLNKIKNEIVIVMNMNKGTMKFIIDNEDKGESYTGIPLDKPLVPVIFLYDKDDSVEVTKC